MENEENRGLFYKKAFEDLLVTFVNAFFGALSLLSLSLSLLDTLNFWSTLALEQEREESRKKEEARKEEHESSSYNMILGRYQFACMFSLLDLACMLLHVVLFCLGMGVFQV